MRKDLELKAQAEAEDSALITIEEVEEEPEEQRGCLLQRQKYVPTKICNVFFGVQARMKMGGLKDHWPFFRIICLNFLKSIGLFTGFFSSQRMTDSYPSFWCFPIRSPNPKKKHPNIQVHHYFSGNQNAAIVQQKNAQPKNTQPKKTLNIFPPRKPSYINYLTALLDGC